MKRLLIGALLLERTWLGLRDRGAGARETACVWLGDETGEDDVAREVMFLDDLPGTVGRRLEHRTSRIAVSMLLDRARELGLGIVGDIHTHPSDWVDLSEVDRAHPIEYRVGLLALVLPFFARGPVDVTSIGVHEYLGAGEWTTFDAYTARKRLIVKHEGATE